MAKAKSDHFGTATHGENSEAVPAQHWPQKQKEMGTASKCWYITPHHRFLNCENGDMTYVLTSITLLGILCICICIPVKQCRDKRSKRTWRYFGSSNQIPWDEIKMIYSPVTPSPGGFGQLWKATIAPAFFLHPLCRNNVWQEPALLPLHQMDRTLAKTCDRFTRLCDQENRSNYDNGAVSMKILDFLPSTNNQPV